MRRYTFTVAEHEEIGELGFRPDWYPHGDPLFGTAVAHDILEHFPGDPGDAEHELKALGAAYWIRGETGFMQRAGNVNRPEAHLAADFPDLLRHLEEQTGAYTLRACPIRARVPDHVETAFREVLRQAVELWRDEYTMRVDEEEPSLVLDHDFCACAVAWLAAGYQAARRRYRGVDPYDVAYQLFEPIEEQADLLLKGAERGERLTVSVNRRQLTVRLSLRWPGEEDEDI